MAYLHAGRVDIDWLKLGGWSDFITAGGKGDALTAPVKIKAGSVISSIVTPSISIVSVGCGG